MDKKHDYVFDVKHRLLGAAILILVAVVVLPWVLGSPKVNQAKEKSPLNVEVVSTQKKDELIELSVKKPAPIVFDEGDVYISKITPLDKSDGFGLTNSPETKNKHKEIVPPKKTIALKEQSENKEKKENSIKQEKRLTRVESAKKQTGQPKEVEVKNKKQSAVPDTKKSQTEKAKNQPDNPQISVGWAVQVGVFTDKNGVAKFIKDLRSKGFKPSTTTVDTKRGKGTRIWLGPFPKRIEAAKMIEKLKKKTGSAGFIRAYP